MRRILCVSAALAGLAAAGAAHAEHICTAVAPDPAVTVALRFSDDGKVRGGEVHWAVPGEMPGLPSMVHIVYPLDGDHAAARPNSVITLNAVTGKEITRSPTASVQIVIDGMDMAVRAWDLYGEAVEQLEQKSTADGLQKASFVGAVTFTPSFQDGQRDVDSAQALSKIGKGASTLQVRLLGQDGMAMQDHTYRLFDMPAPPVRDVQAALAKATQMAGASG
ncbi:MAG: hypothetical protein ACXWK1_07490, partial [Caulobacteraceae bacterium]